MGPLKKLLFWCNGPSIKAPQIPLGHQKKIILALFLSNLAILKNATILGGLNLCENVNWPSQLHAQRSNMHSNPLGQSEKNSFCLKATRYARYVRSSEKNPILGHTERLKKVLRVVRCSENALQGPKKVQIPRGSKKKMFIAWKVCDFVGKAEISCLRGVGWVPSKSSHFGATAPA